MRKGLVTTVILFSILFFSLHSISCLPFNKKIAGQKTQFKDTQQDGEQDESGRTLDPPLLINVSKP